MNLVACGKIDKTTGELINYKNGSQELEVNLIDINALSDTKAFRLIGINKDLYKLTAKSYTKIKKELNKSNYLWRIRLEKSA